MATIIEQPSQDKPHSHLELHALVEGGYVIREGRFDNSTDRDDRHWMPRWEQAAFSTLDEALAWMKTRMINRSPEKAKR